KQSQGEVGKCTPLEFNAEHYEDDTRELRGIFEYEYESPEEATKKIPLPEKDSVHSILKLDEQEKTSTENSLQKKKSISFYPGTKVREIHSRIEAINCGELDDPDEVTEFVVSPLDPEEEDEEWPEDLFHNTVQNACSEYLGINEDTVRESIRIQRENEENGGLDESLEEDYCYSDEEYDYYDDGPQYNYEESEYPVPEDFKHRNLNEHEGNERNQIDSEDFYQSDEKMEFIPRTSEQPNIADSDDDHYVEDTRELRGVFEYEYENPEEVTNKIPIPEIDSVHSILKLDEQEKTTSTENSLQKKKSISFYPGTKVREIHSRIEAINCGELDDPDEAPEFVVSPLDPEEEDEEWPEDLFNNTVQNACSEYLGINEDTVRESIRMQREKEESGGLDESLQEDYCYSDEEYDYYDDGPQYNYVESEYPVPEDFKQRNLDEHEVNERNQIDSEDFYQSDEKIEFIPRTSEQPNIADSDDDHYVEDTRELRGVFEYEYENPEEVTNTIPIPEIDSVHSILKLDEQEKTTSTENSLQKKKSISFYPGTKVREIHSRIEAINCGELDDPDEAPEFVVSPLDPEEEYEEWPEDLFHNTVQNACSEYLGINEDS
ncbi:hypothetical protein LOTGIDRAFT_176912, partial [Lottia gigantea]